jgi:chemotaxis protein CheC
MSMSFRREDVLKELFNVGVGKAASNLSEIIDKKINLDIPDVRIMDMVRGKEELDAFLHRVTEGAAMVSSISFNRRLEGTVSLIFPAEKMHQFINLCLKEEYSENNSLEFSDVDFDTIKEIGNIILNAIIGELSNTLQIPVEYTLPEVAVLQSARADLLVSDKTYHLVLMMYITFNIEGTMIDGAIVINMTLKSLDEIIENIDKIYGGD